MYCVHSFVLRAPGLGAALFGCTNNAFADRMAGAGGVDVCGLLLA